MPTTEPVGALVRRWRLQRRRSQLDLSLAAGTSARHLSYVETGRAMPSRDMIERLCDELEVPLRERNLFHLAAGYAPAHAERPFTDLGAVREAVRSVLDGLEPNPALVVNVHWELLAANQAMNLFLTDLPAELTAPPANVLRATLHPDGLASRISNLAQWRAHVLRRVRRQLDRTGSPGLAALHDELASYPAPNGVESASPDSDLIGTLRLSAPDGELAFLYTVTVFGAPKDVTLDEIAIETFFPADDRTAEALRALSASRERLPA